MLEWLRAVVAKVLRVVFTLVGVTLAAALVLMGLLMAGVLALVAKLSGRPIVFRRMPVGGGFKPPFPPPFQGPFRARRAEEGEVIDAEVREVTPGADASRVIELPPQGPDAPRRPPGDPG